MMQNRTKTKGTICLVFTSICAYQNVLVITQRMVRYSVLFLFCIMSTNFTFRLCLFLPANYCFVYSLRSLTQTKHKSEVYAFSRCLNRLCSVRLNEQNKTKRNRYILFVFFLCFKCKFNLTHSFHHLFYAIAILQRIKIFRIYFKLFSKKYVKPERKKKNKKKKVQIVPYRSTNR